MGRKREAEGGRGGQGLTADVGGAGSDLKVRVRTWTLREVNQEVTLRSWYVPGRCWGRAGRDCGQCTKVTSRLA